MKMFFTYQLTFRCINLCQYIRYKIGLGWRCCHISCSRKLKHSLIDVACNSLIYLIWLVSLYQQAEEEFYDYILHGIPNVDVKNKSQSGSKEFVIYILPENKNYSIFLEVLTLFGAVNISLDIFSKKTQV